MITEIWYSVQNGGDGSAYPEFMEFEEMCKIDQEYMYEGWVEPCVGCLRVKHSGTIEALDVLSLDVMIATTKESIEEGWNEEGVEEKKLEKLLELQVTKKYPE